MISNHTKKGDLCLQRMQEQATYQEELSGQKVSTLKVVHVENKALGNGHNVDEDNTYWR